MIAPRASAPAPRDLEGNAFPGQARKPSLGVFVSTYPINNSPSILNLLNAAARRYRVRLLLDRCRQVDGQALATRGIEVWSWDARRSMAYLAARLRSRLRPPRHLVAIDPLGMCLCQQFLPRARAVYYSLELHLKDDHFGLRYTPEIRRGERRGLRRATGLIIQSAEKAAIFKREHGLPESFPTFHLPVTYVGSSDASKHDYLRRRFNIPDDRRIALHLGGIAEWFSCLELAETFSREDGWALVFHGYPIVEYEARLRAFLKERGVRNVFINDERFDDLDQLQQVVRSADVGIAWYNDVSVGFRTAGFSSGKIAAYLRHGLPVIAKRYPSTVEALEGPGCGVCVDRHDQIGAALAQLAAALEARQAAACAEYDRRYNFELYEKGLLDFIEHPR